MSAPPVGMASSHGRCIEGHLLQGGGSSSPAASLGGGGSASCWPRRGLPPPGSSSRAQGRRPRALFFVAEGARASDAPPGSSAILQMRCDSQTGEMPNPNGAPTKEGRPERDPGFQHREEDEKIIRDLWGLRLRDAPWRLLHEQGSLLHALLKQENVVDLRGSMGLGACFEMHSQCGRGAWSSCLHALLHFEDQIAFFHLWGLRFEAQFTLPRNKNIRQSDSKRCNFLL